MRLRFYVALSVSILSVAAATPAFALANRVFVSARSGNNANACDNINTPCQTFAGAVLQLNPGGEAIVLDSGGYGPVTITQSLTIEAPPGVLAFIHPAAGDAITVNAGPTDVVVLRGLVLNGGPNFGILVNTAGTVHIENCVISAFLSNGINVLAASNTFIKDTICRQNAKGLFVDAGRVSIDHCRFEGNGQQGVIVFAADVTIRDSVSAGNVGNGFEAQASLGVSTILNLYQCISTNNGGDGLHASNGGAGFVFARVANSSISENFGAGLNNLGGGGGVTLASLGNNFVEGNLAGPTLGTITLVSPH